MALSAAQESRLAMVNDLITTDPAAAHDLADRLAELTAEAARRGERQREAEQEAGQ